MAGFVLKNTLSDNGGVTRGICKMDENGNLTEVVETKNIVKTVAGAEADGVAVDVNSLVSMNMWGLTPEFLDVLEEGFEEFFEKEVSENPLKSEFLIPIYIGELLEQGEMSVKVLKTNDTWYGMTYHEDVAAVKDSFKNMLEKGVYNVFCKPFLHKFAKSFCRLLHLHFVGNCKTSAGNYSASHKPLQIIFSCYNTRYGNGSSVFLSSCACSLK